MKMKWAYEHLTTIATETEGILNNQPLTYPYDDEIEKVLTSAHLYYWRTFLDEHDESADDEQIPEILDSEIFVKR